MLLEERNRCSGFFPPECDEVQPGSRIGILESLRKALDYNPVWG
jgi:hypothetical protein